MRLRSRPSVTGPARRVGVARVLAVLVLIVGVIAMHTMGGSSSVHAPMVMAGTNDGATTEAPHVTVGHDGRENVTSPAVSSVRKSPHATHGAVVAMCLMILVTGTVLTVLGAGTWTGRLLAVPGGYGRMEKATTASPRPPPSLMVLGISRT